MQRLPEKAFGVPIVGRGEARRTGVVVRDRLEWRIPQRLGDGSRTLAGRSRLGQVAGDPEVLAHVDGHPGQPPSIIERVGDALRISENGQHPPDFPEREERIPHLEAKVDRQLHWSRKVDDRQEEANSLRLLADAKAAEKAYGEAADFYREALATDKDMGFSAKIATDLFGIGNALCMQGLQEEARVYFKRAHSVSKSLGDNKGAALAEEMIGKCKKTGQ